MNQLVLEELHRLRTFHIGQLNAFNISGSIGIVIACLTILTSDKIPRFPSAIMAWIVIGVLVALWFALFGAASLHWDHHAGQIRRIDGLLQAEYAAHVPTPVPPAGLGAQLIPPPRPPGTPALAPLAFGMGVLWNPATVVTGVSVGLLGALAIFVIAIRILP